MATNSSIEWTDATWNPVAGCAIVSAGCKNCYAMRMANRLEAMGQPQYVGLTRKVNGHAVWTGKINLVESALLLPLSWRKPRKVFVNSMSDLFHPDVPFEYVDKVFAVMALCPKHTFQILTKRPERMAEYLASMNGGGAWNRSRGWEVRDGELVQCSGRIQEWPLPNVWLGTSVENRAALKRITRLAECDAAVRFISFEPLLEDPESIRGYLEQGIHLAIIGGESGPKSRVCDLNWIRSIAAQCRDVGVSVFIKQLGAAVVQHCSQCGRMAGRCAGGMVDSCGPTHTMLANEARAVRDPKGGDMEEWPVDLRVRELPCLLPPDSDADL